MKHFLQRHALIPFAVVCVLCATAGAQQPRPDLSGTIVDADSAAPLEDATVRIWTARVRTGTSTFCPSCYADCAKSAATAPDGSFRITSLDPTLLFNVLVVREGYEPTLVERVDPLAEPMHVELKAVPVERLAPERTIRGRVVDQHGSPVAGATINPVGLFMPRPSMAPQIIDSDAKCDPLAVTNSSGEFVLPIEDGALDVEAWAERHPHFTPDVLQRMFGDATHFTLAARMDARGFASAIIHTLEPDTLNEITLTPGVTVTGRVIKDSKPLPGVEVGFVQTNRTPAAYVGNYTIGTRDDGTFELPNLPPNQDMVVYGKMPSMLDHGAIAIRTFYTGQDDETRELGDLPVSQGRTLRGRVVLSDNPDATFAPSTRLQVGRDVAWDSQIVELAADGTFEVRGLPEESISISVRVPDYHISVNNPSIDPLNPFRLVGRVSGDLDQFIIVLDPGQLTPEAMAAQRARADKWDWNSTRPSDIPLKGAAP